MEATPIGNGLYETPDGRVFRVGNSHEIAPGGFAYQPPTLEPTPPVVITRYSIKPKVVKKRKARMLVQKPFPPMNRKEAIATIQELRENGKLPKGHKTTNKDIHGLQQYGCILLKDRY
jgi:hypothetical protein